MMLTLPEVQVGQVLAADVVNLQGQVLIKAGQVLTAAHLKLLKTWGIKAVKIRSGADDSSKSRRPVDRRLVERAAVIERRRFRLCDLGQPWAHSLFALAVKFRVDRLEVEEQRK